MGHCGKFGCALWATAADLVMSYGPMCGMKPYKKKICDNLCALGHSAGFGDALWAKCRIGYVPWAICRTRLAAMGRSEGFGSALLAVAHYFVVHYGP